MLCSFSDANSVTCNSVIQPCSSEIPHPNLTIVYSLLRLHEVVINQGKYKRCAMQPP